MARRDGADVPESDRVLASGHLVGGDVPSDDSAEQAVGHGEANLLRDDAAARFLWDARNSESARARAREHWIRQQAREAATFGGILRALSERGASVTAWTLDGGSATGVVTSISHELVVVSSRGAPDTWLVRRNLAGVTAASDGFDAGVASDDRGPSSAVTLAGLLAELAEDRVAVIARCGGTEIAGRLAGAGTDVLTLRLLEGGLSYLPIAGLSLLRLA